MLRYAQHPDIFLSSDQALVNPVNCIGTMGKGLALAFKERYPGMFERYRDACIRRQYRIDRPKLDRQQIPWIINFPTKFHYHDRSHIYSIRHGLDALHDLCIEAKVSSISVPALGCGEGGLPWYRVKDMLDAFGKAAPFLVTIYPPHEEQVWKSEKMA